MIAGGTGLLGAALHERLNADGHTVAVLTRRPKHPADVPWDPERPDERWTSIVAHADAVVNLAGESIAGGRWTAARKERLRTSRLVSTGALATAVRDSATPPAFLSASAIGIYGDRGATVVTEETAPGDDFLARLCVDWEREAQVASGAARVVLLRTGVVLARGGGALPQMALPYRLFAGGPVGTGRQCVSWIHVQDWVEMVAWLLRESRISGPINVTAPSPVTNRQFAAALGRALHRPAIMPTPAFLLRIALGEMAAVLLTGQCVRPERAQQHGFRFRYERVDEALADLYR